MQQVGLHGYAGTTRAVSTLHAGFQCNQAQEQRAFNAWPWPQAHMCHMKSCLIVPAQGACFYRNSSGNTYDFWVKVPGLARNNGNCYCYALDQFRGGFDASSLIP